MRRKSCNRMKIRLGRIFSIFASRPSPKDWQGAEGSTHHQARPSPDPPDNRRDNLGHRARKEEFENNIHPEYGVHEEKKASFPPHQVPNFINQTRVLTMSSRGTPCTMTRNTRPGNRLFRSSSRSPPTSLSMELGCTASSRYELL